MARSVKSKGKIDMNRDNIHPPNTLQKQSNGNQTKFRKNRLADDFESYADGAILYLYMENFITYDSCECYPGPYLNMVIGPNGTGKSTLVSAMALGLGAHPAVLGRSREVGEFVKYGQERSILEIALKLPEKFTEALEEELKHSKESSSAQGKALHFTPDEKSADGVVLIRREISRAARLDTRHGKPVHSEWWVNGRATGIRTVQAIVRALRVQIDNLCQFLPQDKVGDFARLSPSELLIETERAAAPPLTLAAHEQLQRWRTEEIANQTQLEQAQRQLATLIRQDAGMEEILTRLREREALVARLQLAKRKLPFLRYARAREAYEEAKKARDEAKKQLGEAEEELQPMRAELSRHQNELGALRRRIAECKQTIATHSQEFDCLVDSKAGSSNPNVVSLAELARQADALKTQIIKLREQRKRRETSINELKQTIRTMEEDLRRRTEEFESLDHENELKVQDECLAEVDQQLRGLDREVDEADQQELSIRREGERHGREIDALMAQVRDLEDVKRMRIMHIERMAPDVARTYRWLQESENQARFRGRIYGPLALELDLREDKLSGDHRLIARQIESLISRGVLLGFVVTSPEDLEMFQEQICDRLNLKVNVTLVEGGEDNQDDLYRRIPQDELASVGFIGTVEEMLNAPEPVIAVLRDFPKIHLMPLSPKPLEFDLVDKRFGLGNGSGPRWLQKYATSEGVFEVRTSKYGGGEMAVKCTPLKNPVFFANSNNHSNGDDRKTHLQRRIGQIRSELASNTDRMRRILQEKEALNQRITPLKQRRQSIQEERRRIQARQVELRRSKDAVELKKANLGKLVAADRSGRDREEEEDALQELRQTFTKQADTLVRATNALQSLTQEMMKQMVEHGVRVELMEGQLIRLEGELRTREGHLSEFRQAVQMAEQAVQQCKTQAKELLELAMANNDNSNGLDEETKEAFASLPEGLEELEQLIALTSAQLEICEGAGGITAAALQEHETRKETIATLQQSIQQLQEQLQDLITRMDELQNSTWKPTLQKMVGSINQRFSTYFRQMGCAGEVRLTESGRDYDRWALEIRVRFRREERNDNEDDNNNENDMPSVTGNANNSSNNADRDDGLYVLSAYRQSGGEKSVCTILFLLALQGLTNCPFRVVDEINQGMDAINERRVHSLLVDVATNTHEREVKLKRNELSSPPQYNHRILYLLLCNWSFLDTF